MSYTFIVATAATIETPSLNSDGLIEAGRTPPRWVPDRVPRTPSLNSDGLIEARSTPGTRGRRSAATPSLNSDGLIEAPRRRPRVGPVAGDSVAEQRRPH